jgi:hypothetical protein
MSSERSEGPRPTIPGQTIQLVCAEMNREILDFSQDDTVMKYYARVRGSKGHWATGFADTRRKRPILPLLRGRSTEPRFKRLIRIKYDSLFVIPKS